MDHLNRFHCSFSYPCMLVPNPPLLSSTFSVMLKSPTTKHLPLISSFDNLFY
eukprot:c54123_g1_i1 orf=109-264(+)